MFKVNEEATQELIDSQSVRTKGAILVHKANLHDMKMGYWVTSLATFAYPTLHRFAVTAGIVALLFTTLTNILLCK